MSREKIGFLGNAMLLSALIDINNKSEDIVDDRIKPPELSYNIPATIEKIEPIRESRQQRRARERAEAKRKKKS